MPTVSCPTCAARIKVPSDDKSNTAKCPRCSETITIVHEAKNIVTTAIAPHHEPEPQQQFTGSQHVSDGESEIYRDGSVLITATRMVIGTKTYALRNITSVEMRRIPGQANQMWALIPLALFASFFLGSLAGTTDQSNIVIFLGVVLPLPLIWVGWSCYDAGTEQFAIRVASTSGETDALVSFDKARIQYLVGAVNAAIALAH